MRTGKLYACWKSFLSSDDGKAYKRIHPDLTHVSNVSELDTCIPLTIHEDAGPYAKKRRCNIVSVSSLLCNGTELETKYVVFSNIKDTDDPHDAAAGAWKALFADLIDLARGATADGHPLVVRMGGTSW